MGVYVSPLVATREINLSLYTPGLSTTLFGVVGLATKGAVNDVTTITNVADFISTFGSPKADFYGSYAALQYLRQGTQLLFIRVGGDSLANAEVDLPGESTTATITSENTENFTLAVPTAADITGSTLDLSGSPITVGPNSGEDGDTLVLEVDGVDYELTLLPNTYDGTAGNDLSDLVADLQTQSDAAGMPTGVSVTWSSTSGGALQVTHDNTGSTSTLEIKSTGFSTGAVEVYTALGFAGTGVLDTQVAGTDGTDKFDITIVNDGGTPATYNVTLTAGSRTAAQVASDINDVIAASGVLAGTASATSAGEVRIQSTGTGTDSTLRVEDTSTSASVLGFDGTGVLETDVAGTGDEAVTLTVTAATPGTWGDDLSIVLSNENTEDRGTTGDGNPYFQLQVFDGTIEVERFRDLSHLPADTDNYVVTVLANESEYVTAAEESSGSQGLRPEMGTYELSGGNDGDSDVNAADFIGVTSPANTGLEILNDPERIDVNLIAVPGVSETLGASVSAGDDPGAAVINRMLELCEDRGDCMAIIDPPDNLSYEEVADWHNGQGWDHQSFNSSYGAVYNTWVKIYDQNTETEIFTPPSGHVAAAYAYNDQVAEAWFAPAGLQRGRILAGLALRDNPDQGQRDLLYGDGNAVNPIVDFPTDGIVIWGQRTLQRSPTALDRVNVRRLLLHARKVIATATRQFVFQPNDSTTWIRFRNLVSPFMEHLRTSRGVTEFRVVMDETTNTPAVIDRNEMRGQIFLKPTKSAEFIVVDFVVLSTGASFSEIEY